MSPLLPSTHWSQFSGETLLLSGVSLLSKDKPPFSLFSRPPLSSSGPEAIKLSQLKVNVWGICLGFELAFNCWHRSAINKTMANDATCKRTPNGKWNYVTATRLLSKKNTKMDNEPSCYKFLMDRRRNKRTSRVVGSKLAHKLLKRWWIFNDYIKLAAVKATRIFCAGVCPLSV